MSPGSRSTSGRGGVTRARTRRARRGRSGRGVARRPAVLGRRIALRYIALEKSLYCNLPAKSLFSEAGAPERRGRVATRCTDNRGVLLLARHRETIPRSSRASCKRVALITKRAKTELDEIRAEGREISERLIDHYRDVPRYSARSTPRLSRPSRRVSARPVARSGGPERSRLRGVCGQLRDCPRRLSPTKIGGWR
jgi:hypothetical protein